MTNDKIIGLFALGIMAAGCATSGSQTPSFPTSAHLKTPPKANYSDSIRSISETNVKAGACARQRNQVKQSWNWKEAIEAANVCMRARDLVRVDEIGNELSIREPGAPWGPFFLATAARQRGEFERALWMSELALKRAPEIGLVHYLRAQVLWDKKEFGPAVAGFEKSTDFDSSIIPAHLFLGQIYFRDQDFHRASKHFYAVLKLVPRHPLALSGLAESELHENNPRGALDAYSRLVDSNPKDGQYLSRIAEIYETVLHDSPSALSAYRHIREMVRSGKVQQNIDPELDAKIKELELSTQKARALASSEGKEKTQ